MPKHAIQKDVVFLLPFPVRWHKTFRLTARKSNNSKRGCTGQRTFSPWALPPPPDTSRCLGRSVNDRSSLYKTSSLKYFLALFFSESCVISFYLIAPCGFLFQELVRSLLGLMENLSIKGGVLQGASHIQNLHFFMCLSSASAKLI